MACRGRGVSLSDGQRAELKALLCQRGDLAAVLLTRNKGSADSDTSVLLDRV